MDDIRVFFILSENGCEDDASDIMSQAYELCRSNSVNISWVEETKLDINSLLKTDFLVFDAFEGNLFEQVQESKSARIVGPWCVLACLMEGKSIPNFTWSIFNVAMSGCVVACSHLPKTKKQDIKDKVQLMGGRYTDILMSSNTHLITASVKSEKYLLAAEAGAKLMLPEWVDAVWNSSQSKILHCNDEQFNKYKCLPFHNLVICCTGCNSLEVRKELAENVAKNGGIFTAALTVAKTDVLVCYGSDATLSKKYKAARTNPNLFCVTIDWINDSIEKGYALPHTSYQLKKSTSTPSKDSDACLPDFSMMSAITDLHGNSHKSTIEETISLRSSQPSFAVLNKISPNKRKSFEDVNTLIDGFDIKRAKKAGQYLDGCSVYVAGFKAEQREKLCKILNLSGATRYDDISERVTHVIVGDSSCPEVKMIKAKNYPVCLVSIHWLLDSMESQHPKDEENYLINLNALDKEQFSSPLGRKGLNLLRTNKTLTSSDIEAANNMSSNNLELPEIDADLMEHYRSTTNKDEDADTLAQLLNADSNFKKNFEQNKEVTNNENSCTYNSSLQDLSSQPLNLFQSKTFVIINFSIEVSQCLKDQIESECGSIMTKNYKGIPDFVVAPMFITMPIQVSALEIVNNLWVIESIEQGELQPFMYYHRPLVIEDKKPLQKCVVTISGYPTYERNFLKELIEQLGGVSQEQFARIKSQERQVLASTHLISLETDGKKYKAALKWGLPVVNKDWLFECAKTGRFIPETNFLMGDSKCPPATPNSIKNVYTTPSTENNKKDTPQDTSKTNRILTPLNQKEPLDISKIETPINQRLFKGLMDTPDPCSQVTPINKIMEEVRRTNLLGTPQTPPMPKSWYNVDTPESPFGAAIKPHMSPKSKKELMRYINCIPDFVPMPKERKSTPLSEVKRRCWKKLLGQDTSGYFTENKTQAPENEIENVANDDSDENDEDQENAGHSQATSVDTQNVFINTKLKQIEGLMSGFGENRRSSKAFDSTVATEVCIPDNKDTQPFTVGWDYNASQGTASSSSNQKSAVRIFIISGVENDGRQEIVDKIEGLGAHVSDLNSYDPQCTHLICPQPARNEKTLACMAAGKWILHISYIEKSVAAGKFLNEEEFEFGNPASKDNIKGNFDKDYEIRMQAIHWWRKEITRRGYGAFNDMRAIVIAQKRGPIVRVIEAGGGHVVDVTPPFGDSVHATHCLLELRCVKDFNVYNPLAQQGILCINTLYISDFLYRTNKDIKDAILPHYSRFYSKS